MVILSRADLKDLGEEYADRVDDPLYASEHHDEIYKLIDNRVKEIIDGVRQNAFEALDKRNYSESEKERIKNGLEETLTKIEENYTISTTAMPNSEQIKRKT